MKKLAQKTVLITGASSGFGKAIALAFAVEGANVALIARREEALQKVAQLAQKHGVKTAVFPTDVANEAQVKTAVTQTRAELGPIDILINNAGMNITQRRIQDTSSAQWRQLLDVNLTSAFLFTKAILPEMIERAQGTIINIASRAALHPDIASGVAYSTSKMGMDALTQVTNEEASAYNVRACLLCPGSANTPILDHRPVPPTDEAREKMLQAEDIAAVALLIASLPPRVKIELVSMVQTR